MFSRSAIESRLTVSRPAWIDNLMTVPTCERSESAQDNYDLVREEEGGQVNLYDPEEDRGK